MSTPTPAHTIAQGYGNIYTPHAGSMVIQVQRELGLANRTIVLSPRKVRLLRFFTSKLGITLAVMLAASWLVLAIQAVRVPLLTNRLRNLEHTAQRLDTLETTLSRLQYRYNQVHRLLGPSAAATASQTTTVAGAPAAASTQTAATAATAAATTATATPQTAKAPATQKPAAAPQKPASVPQYGATSAPAAVQPPKDSTQR